MTTTSKVIAALVAAAVMVGTMSTTAFTAPLSVGRAGVHLKQGTLFLTKDTGGLFTTLSTGSDQAQLYLLQVKGPVLQQYVDTLRRMGVEMGDYLPDDAYVVRMDGRTRTAVAKLDFVTGMQHYDAQYKLDPALTGKQRAQVRVMTFAAGDRLTVAADSQGLQQLAAQEDVTYVEPVQQNQVFNDKAAPIIGVSDMRSAGYDGQGQIVAITDTGLDNGVNDSTMHPDFQGQIKQLTALGRPGDASDTVGHGTHVAGSVLGTGKASNGQFKGMAPGAKLVFQSVADSKGGLGGVPDDLTTLFSSAYQAGARIHSNSWGVPANQGGETYDAQSQSVDKFMWQHPDYTILFAAGNDGDPNRDGTASYGTVSTPGTAKNAITVGASENYRPDQAKLGDDTNKIATFSSRGPTGDGRVKPDVVAPGTWILSTKSRKADDKEFWKTYNEYYAYMGGTSMATPITAGAVADLRQYFMQQVGITPMASLLKASLINGAVDMGEGQDTRDQGWGRINLNNSVLNGGVQYVNESKALATGDSATYTYHVTDSKKPLKVTLAWTDYPADPSASKTLVNDLDLTVTTPDGTVHKGNEDLGAGVDHTNNVEQVNLGTPQAGDYSVTVKGYNVPEGPQKFALVVSGDTSSAPGQKPNPPQNPNPQPPADSHSSPVGMTFTGHVDANTPYVSYVEEMGAGPASAHLDIASTDGGVPDVAILVFDENGNQVATADGARSVDVAWQSTGGVYNLLVYRYGGSADFALQTHHAQAAGVRLDTFSGQVDASGQANASWNVQVARDGVLDAGVSWQGQANLDLYLLDAQGNVVASATSQSLNPETISAQVSAGTYTLTVAAASGASPFQLQVSHP